MKKRSILFLIALFSAFAIQAQTVDEILASYFENTGGLDNWKKLNTMKVDGKMSMQGMDFNFALLSKRPNMQKVEVNVQGTQIIQAFDGKDAWMLNPFAGGTEPTKMDDEQAKDFTTQKFEDEFVDYKKKGHEATLLGVEEVDGVACYKIQLIKNKTNDKEDITELHYFDKENFVPIMRVSYALSGEAKGQEVKTYLSDYMEVDGFMIPAFMESKVNGQSVQKMTFQKVVLNEPIDDAVFAFPKK